MKTKLILLLTILYLANCATTVKIPVVKSSPAGFNEFMQGGRNLGIYVYKNQGAEMGDMVSDWKTTVNGSVMNALQKKGYFKIVDVSSREARLKEVAFSQKMGGMKDISKDLSVDALLFVEVPQSPLFDCRESSKLLTRKECAVYDANRKCLSYVNKQYTQYQKELISTVFVKARMVNLETGQTIQHTNSEPARVTKTSESPHFECPSVLDGFNKALEVSSDAVADKLSPQVENLKVPLYDNADGIQSSSFKGDVQSLLSTGNKWMDTDNPNLEQAKKNWEQALQISGNRSASANWNLGVYHWSQGDLTKADDYFKQAVEKGGPGWVDSDRRELLSTFETEKQRDLKGRGIK